MTGLLIIGAGGHGKVVAETAIATGKWDNIGFLDDRFEQLTGAFPWPVIGPVDEAETYVADYPEAVVALGDASIRLELIAKLETIGYALPCIIHPSAWISPSASLGEGSVVLPMAAVNTAVRAGRGCIINTGATVDHDSILGDGVHVCPGSHLAGEVEAGSKTWIGIGSCVIQQIRIGESVIVAAGAVVTNDIQSAVTVAGVPAEEISGGIK